MQVRMRPFELVQLAIILAVISAALMKTNRSNALTSARLDRS